MKKLILFLMVMILSFSLLACQSSNDEGQNANVESATANTENAPTNTESNAEEVADTENSTDNEASDSEETEEVVVVAGTISLTKALAAVGVELAAIPVTEKALPESVENLPRIGMPMNPDLELVKSFEPDYFFTDGMLKNSLDASFQEQNIPVEYISMSSYDNVIETLTYFGTEFGKEEEAKKVIDEIRAYEEEAKAIYENHEPKTVAVIFGVPGNFMLTTSRAFTGELVSKVGSINITDDMEGAMAPYIPFSLETLAEKDPDVILRLTHVSPEESKKMFDEEFANNTFYGNLKAVKDGQVYDLDPSMYGVTATIDCGKALLNMTQLIYGE